MGFYLGFFVQSNNLPIDMSNKPVRRIVDASKVVVMPSVENLIADATGIIELELVKFHTKVRQGKSLDAIEGRLLNGYIRSLVDLLKEQRERDKENDLSKLTTDELISLLQSSGSKDKVAADIKKPTNDQD